MSIDPADALFMLDFFSSHLIIKILRNNFLRFRRKKRLNDGISKQIVHNNVALS